MGTCHNYSRGSLLWEKKAAIARKCGAKVGLWYTKLNPTVQVLEEISGYAKRLGIREKGYHSVHLFPSTLNHDAALPARNLANSSLSCLTSALRLVT